VDRKSRIAVFMSLKVNATGCSRISFLVKIYSYVLSQVVLMRQKVKVRWVCLIIFCHVKTICQRILHYWLLLATVLLFLYYLYVKMNPKAMGSESVDWINLGQSQWWAVVGTAMNPLNFFFIKFP
jgi:hypothetical protein